MAVFGKNRKKKPKQTDDHRATAYVDKHAWAETLRVRQRLAYKRDRQVSMAEAIRQVFECGLTGTTNAPWMHQSYTLSHTHDKDETQVSLARLMYAWHVYLLGPKAISTKVTLTSDGKTLLRLDTYGAKILEAASISEGHLDSVPDLRRALDDLADKYQNGAIQAVDKADAKKDLRELWRCASMAYGVVAVGEPTNCRIADPIGRFGGKKEYNEACAEATATPAGTE